MSKSTRLAALTLGMTAAAIAPLLAKDAKIELPKSLFADITSKNIVSKKPALLAGVKLAATGKLRQGMAMDASMEHVGKVLDAVSGLFEGKEGADESASEEQHKAMEAAAHGESNLGIPKAVGEEFSQADKGKSFDAEPFKAFLKEKGMGDEDIAAAMDMLPKPAMDAEETEEAKKKRELAEKAAGDESPEEKEKREKAEKEAADAAIKAKDAEMQDVIKKPAMDAAIKAAVTTVRETERGIRSALAQVRPYVGELPETMAFDSAADVKRHALTMLGVDGAKTLHADALDAVLSVQRKAGARPSEAPAHIAMDAETSKSFATRFPGSDRIQAA